MLFMLGKFLQAFRIYLEREALVKMAMFLFAVFLSVFLKAFDSQHVIKRKSLYFSVTSRTSNYNDIFNLMKKYVALICFINADLQVLYCPEANHEHILHNYNNICLTLFSDLKACSVQFSVHAGKQQSSVALLTARSWIKI